MSMLGTSLTGIGTNISTTNRPSRRSRHLNHQSTKKQQQQYQHHASIMTAISYSSSSPSSVASIIGNGNHDETNTSIAQKMRSNMTSILSSTFSNLLPLSSIFSFHRRYYIITCVLIYILISIGCSSLPKNKKYFPSEESQPQSLPSQSIEETNKFSPSNHHQDSPPNKIRGALIKDENNDDMINSLLRHDLANLERHSDNEQINIIVPEITQKHDVDPNFILNQFQDSNKPVLTGHETPKQLEEIMKQYHNTNVQKKDQTQAQNVQISPPQQPKPHREQQTSPSLPNTVSNVKTIAYFLSVYTCPTPYKPKDHTATSETLSEQRKDHHESISDTSFLDAAAILKYSIHRSSIHNSLSGGKYSYKMIALVHPSVQNCHDRNGFSRKDALLKLGYEVHIVDIPIESLSSISNQFLRENISNSGRRQHDAISDKKGSGGERDLIRLKAFEFVQYEIGVLVDLRTLIINPLDDVFDYFLLSKEVGEHSGYKGEIQFAISDKQHDNILTTTTTASIQALYTRDYSSVSPGKYKVGIHPGFFIFRPSLQTYNDLVDILRKGEYDPKLGWYGKTGTFWGSMTTRGLLDYYYNHHSTMSGEAKELNRCVYNNLGASPHIRENGKKVCRNRNESIELNTCQDCRTFSLENIKVANLSVCRDPWSCYLHDETLDSLKLCRDYHHHWFILRRELENAWEEFGGGGQFENYEPSPKIGKERPLHFLGYCHSLGEEGQGAGSSTESYIAMKPPNSDQRGPHLDPNQVLYQFRSPVDHPDGMYNGHTDNTYDNVQTIVKPKKHFDPEEVIFQFQEGHPKRDRIQG